MTQHVHPALRDLRVEAFADRDAWLASRRAPDTIGASEAAMALGISPWGTGWSLWESKRQPAEKRSAVLTRGHRWEPAVLAEYGDESGHRVLTPGQACAAESDAICILSRPDLPWLRATPDALAEDAATGELGHVEAKTAMRAHEWAPEPGVVIDSWRDEYAEIVPPYYAVQGYVQLEVSQLPWNDLCALVPRSGWLGVRWVRLMRDVDTQTALVEALAEWRQRHLVEGEPPPIDDSKACNRYLTKRFATGKTKPTRTATDEEMALMRELHDTRAAEKSATAKAKALSNDLLARAEGYRLRVPGVGTKAPFGQPQGSAGRTTVDLDGLRAEAPELVKKYERQGQPFASFRLYHF